MANIVSLIKKNSDRWYAMKVHPEKQGELDRTAKRLLSSKDRFKDAESRVVKEGYFCPWWFIAICAEREYGGPPHWDKQLAQGDPLNRISIHDPAGRGPFLYHDDASMKDAWERGCLDALIDCAPHAAKWLDWSPGGVATIFEEYNGLGYANMGVPSAYVWSGSDQYTSGKYVADHDYRAGVVDVQEGCMPILSRMMVLDRSITFGGRDMPNTVPSVTTVPVQSAWYSKINWTQAAGVFINVATLVSGALPPQYAAPVAIGVQTAQSLLTWYFKTFQTTSVTPASVATMRGQ